jgi:carboxylate-amine ligase
MKNGTGADRQLRVFQETGDMKAVVDYIIEETEAGIDKDEIDTLPAAKAV